LYMAGPGLIYSFVARNDIFRFERPKPVDDFICDRGEIRADAEETSYAAGPGEFKVCIRRFVSGK
jgi:hypothetical protein